MARESRNTTRLCEVLFGNRFLPVSVGPSGALLGWLIWQLLNTPHPANPSGWEANLISSAALNPTLAGWGIGTVFGSWLRGELDRRERYEQRIEELTRKREEDNAWWREYTQRQDRHREEDIQTRDRQHNVLVSLLKDIRNRLPPPSRERTRGGRRVRQRY